MQLTAKELFDKMLEENDECTSTEMMKTTLQEFIEYLEGIKERDNVPSWIVTTAKNYLEIEKQQIEDAFKAGEKNIDFIALNGYGKLSSANKYYTENYGRIKKTTI